MSSIQFGYTISHGVTRVNPGRRKSGKYNKSGPLAQPAHNHFAFT
jgi:hypothetical protein